MRSRYTAFVKRQWNYLASTMNGEAAQEFDMAAARKDALVTQWLQLEVLHAEETGDTAIVEFKAHFRYKKQLAVLREVSHFAKIDGQWFYVSGVPVQNRIEG